MDNIHQQVQAFLSQLSDKDSQFAAEYLLKKMEELPRCNGCGDLFEGGWGSIAATINWGYESTGKDTDSDKWKLCRECSNQFRQKYLPRCSMCEKQIVEVMATLASRRQGSSFYGNYYAALKHYTYDEHCGLEYASVEGRIICEICYETFVDSFKLPIPKGSYQILSGDYREDEGTQNTNRIERALNYTSSGDSISNIYNHYLSYQETVELRQAADAASRVFSISYREYKPEYRKLKTSRQSYISLSVGDGSYLYVPLLSLERSAIDAGLIATSDFHDLLHDLEVLEHGHRVRIGNLQIDTLSLISEWKGFVPDGLKPMSEEPDAKPE